MLAGLGWCENGDLLDQLRGGNYSTRVALAVLAVRTAHEFMRHSVPTSPASCNFKSAMREA
jgi:hypothetical protein